MPPQSAGGRPTWLESFLVYRKPVVVSLAFLGFSAGLPYLLVFSTLTAWLRDEGVSRSAIGFFAWVGMMYSIKVVWAPFVDRLKLPWLDSRLGRRRSWMLVAQVGIMAALLGMSWVGSDQLTLLAILALAVAFSSATQDIAIDAYRIEAAPANDQAALSAAYILGYRSALLVSGAGALYAAEYLGWVAAYQVMAVCGGVGLVTTLLIPRPALANDESPPEPDGDRSTWPGFQVMFLAPIADFFVRNGRFAVFLLSFIALYRLSDITMGIMANPFYLDLGYSKLEIANIAKGLGFALSILGSFLGGVLVVRWGVLITLLIGGVAVALTNLLFAALALTEPNLIWLGLIIGADNLSGGIAATSFIAYLSSLTHTAYTATQYALFSSLMTLPGKFTSGFSGIAVDSVGYPVFFIGAGVLGIPAIVMVLYLIHRESEPIVRA
ncbi:MAG: MFS transporter [Pseudomonadales bacterium]|jgi:PAT family beta-lactamase induction signal transducer AmpG|tara:strand:+ start:2553 stop:3866 length:1314 start_codon:yes stop_codon:yes gene_type:complete